MSEKYRPGTPLDFSLTAGGPIYQLLLRLRLGSGPLDLLGRRVTVITLFAWLPPFLLSVMAGTALEGVPVPFVYDLATQARFLVALPLLILAERVIQRRLEPALQQFVGREIVLPEALPRFQSLLASVLRWRNSTAIEVGLIVTVFAVTHLISQEIALKTSTWYARFTDQGSQMTAAGAWYSWVSMPLFQFILLRWFYRWGLWTSLLWRMNRLPLKLIPTHPDHAAGLSFLSRTATAFSPVLFALSSILSGVVAGKILYEGASLVSFKFEMIVLVVILMLIALGPLCAFMPSLWRAKVKGEIEYGTLSNRYVSDFDRKWNEKNTGSSEVLLGSADIQSLADLANSYAIVDRMRVVPFDRDAVLETAAAALLPLVPLVLFVIPLDQLIAKLLKILF